MSEHAHFLNLKKIALSALTAIRPFIKMDGSQAVAWDIVLQLLGGSPHQ